MLENSFVKVDILMIYIQLEEINKKYQDISKVLKEQILCNNKKLYKNSINILKALTAAFIADPMLI